MNLVKDIPPSDSEGTYNVIIDIPLGSTQKIEYDENRGIFYLDRIEPAIFAKPVNYGFIPGSRDGDGDPLDALIYADIPLSTGLLVKVKPVAILNFMDGGEVDHKIVCMPEDDRNSDGNIADLTDLPDSWKARIEHHFNHYKDLKKPGTTIVEGWGNKNEAEKVIAECVERYKTHPSNVDSS